MTRAMIGITLIFALCLAAGVYLHKDDEIPGCQHPITYHKPDGSPSRGCGD